MWKCKQCNEEIEDTFDVCWNCGTEKDGTPSKSINEFQRIKKRTAEEISEMEASKHTDELYGVKGWLKFFVVVNLYIAPIFFVLNYIITWIGFSILSEDYPNIIFVGIVETIVGAFLVYKAIQVAKGLKDIREKAVQNAKFLLKLVLAWTIVSIPLSFLTGLDADDLMPDVIKQFFLGIIGFTIWYSYFNVSQRVKATYPDWNA